MFFLFFGVITIVIFSVCEAAKVHLLHLFMSGHGQQDPAGVHHAGRPQVGDCPETSDGGDKRCVVEVGGVEVPQE